MVSLGSRGTQSLQRMHIHSRALRWAPLTPARKQLPVRTTSPGCRIQGFRLNHSRHSVPKAAAAGGGPQSGAQKVDTLASEAPVKEWVALVANAEFMLHDVQNEAMAEQLRERIRLFSEKSREVDFWLVPEPVWLDKRFPEKAKAVKRPCVALVSTDKTWMTFMKLRLDRVLVCDLGPVSKEEALAVGGKVPEFGEYSKWTAPYVPYAKGWWKPFLPEGEAEVVE